MADTPTGNKDTTSEVGVSYSQPSIQSMLKQVLANQAKMESAMREVRADMRDARVDLAKLKSDVMDEMSKLASDNRDRMDTTMATHHNEIRVWLTAIQESVKADYARSDARHTALESKVESLEETCSDLESKV